VTRTEAITELPSIYAVAIRLRDGGADADAIAAALGIDEHAVGPLLALADYKLAALLTNS
jgi:DNA-directed RNA polymerase specialized sigma24 family protein